MKHIAYRQKDASGQKFFLLGDDKELEPSDSFEALMMSRLDFAIKVTEVPPVHQSEMDNLLSYKLKSLYPGDPENTVFDFKVLTKNKKRYAVLFITSKKTIEDYKKSTGNKPLVLPFPIINKLMKKYPDDNAILFFWHKNWLDISIYNNGIFSTSSAIKREKEAFLDFLKIQNILPKNYTEYRCIFLCLNNEIKDIKKQSNELFKKVKNTEFLPLEDSLIFLEKKSDFLFRKRKQAFIFQKKLRIDILLLILAFTISLTFNKQVSNRAEYLSSLKLKLNERIEQSRHKQNYLKLKEKQMTLLLKRPVNIYLLLSEISKIFGNETKITSFKLDTKDELVFSQDGTRKREIFKTIRFVIEGKTKADAFKYINLFNNNPYFEDVQIPKIEGDRFILEGVFDKGVMYALE